METSFSNAGMVSPGHAYTWASPRAPKILWQSLYRDDTALKFRLKADPALWAWSWKFLKECPAERAAINTANKLRLCIYSQGLFDEINRTERIAYDRHVGGALYLYRDREHFDRGVGAMKVLTDGGVRLEPVGPDRIVEIEPALSGEKDNLAGAIYCPTDESGDCHKFSNALADILARDRRVTFHWGTSDRPHRRRRRPRHQGRDQQGRPAGRTPTSWRSAATRRCYAQSRPAPADLPRERLCADDPHRPAQQRAGRLRGRREVPDRLVAARRPPARHGQGRLRRLRPLALGQGLRPHAGDHQGAVSRRRRLRQRLAMGGPAPHDAQGHANPRKQARWRTCSSTPATATSAGPCRWAPPASSPTPLPAALPPSTPPA